LGTPLFRNRVIASLTQLLLLFLPFSSSLALLKSKKAIMSSVRKPNKGTPPNAAAPRSSKKRKASALHDDPAPAKRATSTSNQSRRKSQVASTAPPMLPSTAGTPFRVEYPAKPPKPGKNTDDVFRGRDDGGIPGLAIDYAVRPGSKWTGMRSYKNVKCRSLQIEHPL
jgi:hypothetical protein